MTPPIEPELKPCPFCGSDSEVLSITDNRPSGTCWVVCEICEAEGPAAVVTRTPEGAAEGWNTRAQAQQ